MARGKAVVTKPSISGVWINRTRSSVMGEVGHRRYGEQNVGQHQELDVCIDEWRQHSISSWIKVVCCLATQDIKYRQNKRKSSNNNVCQNTVSWLPWNHSPCCDLPPEPLPLICKGTYTCVKPHKYTYGNYRNTGANVDASDSRCRCVGKIIARDLRLMVSQLYKVAVNRLWVTCHDYLIPLFGLRPAGLPEPL